MTEQGLNGKTAPRSRLRAALAMLLVCAGLGACAAPELPRCDPADDAGAALFVIDHGWHTDLAIAADRLTGPMVRFRQVFPGLRYLLVGFGRRTFMIAPVTDFGDLLIGPLPGDGTLLMAGLNAPPEIAYPDGRLSRFPLDATAAAQLSRFVWDTLRLANERPVVIAKGFFPGSLFYATRTGYSGLYTCNSWTEDALARAGLAPPAHFTVLSSQVMAHTGAVCSIGSESVRDQATNGGAFPHRPAGPPP